MAGTLTVDTIQSDSSYASTLNVASKVNFTSGMQVGGQDATFGGMRNRIINGAMMIDQRNAGVAINTDNAVLFTVDRFFFLENAGTTATTQQVSDAPAGFSNSFKFTNSATTATPDYGQLVQRIEGYNVVDLDFGKATAKTVTLSFWVKSSLTGQFSVSLRNSAANRSNVSTYTINDANTWEYKTITFVGDTTGTWLTTNGNGLELIYRIAGSGGETSLNQWTSTGNAFASGSVNVMGTANATWQITGVQLEKGSAATAFEYRQFGQEFALCQRYYEEQFLQWATAWSAGMNNYSGTFKVTKRVTPTTTAVYASGTNDKTGTVGYVRNTTNSADIVANSLVAESPNNFSIDYNTGSASARNMRAYVTFSSEL
jgi:hypothetical protein